MSVYSIKDQIPLISKELIDRLEEVFPDRIPRGETSMKDVWFALGTVQVVDFLKNVYELQNERE